jgi:hypothetical protein
VSTWMALRTGAIAGAFALMAGAAGVVIAGRGWSLATTLLVGMGTIAVLTFAAIGIEWLFSHPGRRPPRVPAVR